MEMGEGSNSGRRGQKRQMRASGDISYERSVLELSRDGRRTHLAVNRARPRPLNSASRSSSAVFDNTTRAYNWLRAGWLAEERRILATGRLYRYYYDPMGQKYNTRQEVELICRDIERFLANKRNRVVIVLDA